MKFNKIVVCGALAAVGGLGSIALGLLSKDNNKTKLDTIDEDDIFDYDDFDDEVDDTNTEE